MCNGGIFNKFATRIPCSHVKYEGRMEQSKERDKGLGNTPNTIVQSKSQALDFFAMPFYDRGEPAVSYR